MESGYLTVYTIVVHSMFIVLTTTLYTIQYFILSLTVFKPIVYVNYRV